MEGQDWTPVVIRRKCTTNELIKKGHTTIQNRDPIKSEKIRIAKLENSDGPVHKKRINGDSLQQLIKKRLELTLTQEKADMLCSFPRNIFKDIESNRIIPSEEQKRRIQQKFGIQLKIDTI